MTRQKITLLQNDGNAEIFKGKAEHYLTAKLKAREKIIVCHQNDSRNEGHVTAELMARKRIV